MKMFIDAGFKKEEEEIAKVYFENGWNTPGHAKLAYAFYCAGFNSKELVKAANSYFQGGWKTKQDAKLAFKFYNAGFNSKARYARCYCDAGFNSEKLVDAAWQYYNAGFKDDPRHAYKFFENKWPIKLVNKAYDFHKAGFGRIIRSKDKPLLISEAKLCLKNNLINIPKIAELAKVFFQSNDWDTKDITTFQKWANQLKTTHNINLDERFSYDDEDDDSEDEDIKYSKTPKTEKSGDPYQYLNFGNDSIKNDYKKLFGEQNAELAHSYYEKFQNNAGLAKKYYDQFGELVATASKYYNAGFKDNAEMAWKYYNAGFKKDYDTAWDYYNAGFKNDAEMAWEYYEVGFWTDCDIAWKYYNAGFKNDAKKALEYYNGGFNDTGGFNDNADLAWKYYQAGFTRLGWRAGEYYHAGFDDKAEMAWKFSRYGYDPKIALQYFNAGFTKFSSISKGRHFEDKGFSPEVAKFCITRGWKVTDDLLVNIDPNVKNNLNLFCEYINSSQKVDKFKTTKTKKSLIGKNKIKTLDWNKVNEWKNKADDSIGWWATKRGLTPGIVNDFYKKKPSGLKNIFIARFLMCPKKDPNLRDEKDSATFEIYNKLEAKGIELQKKPDFGRKVSTQIEKLYNIIVNSGDSELMSMWENDDVKETYKQQKTMKELLLKALG